MPSQPPMHTQCLSLKTFLELPQKVKSFLNWISDTHIFVYTSKLEMSGKLRSTHPLANLVMPFGLQGAPGVFMNLINDVLLKHLFKGIIYYLNNVLIYSDFYGNHVKLVHQVLQKLQKHKLFAKCSKCKFHKSELDFLGYHIMGEGLKMDPSKV